MKIHPCCIAVVVGLLVMGTVGCSHFSGDSSSTSPSQGVIAIIDLDAVAKQLGYDKQMAGAIHQQKTSLEQQLGVIKTSFVQELEKTKTQIGENPTQEQAQQFNNSQRMANARLIQEKRKADSLLKQYSAQVIQQFRESVKTTARQVASEKGLSIILTKNDSVVFDYDTAVDITEAVVERMRAAQPAPSASPAVAENGAADAPAADDPAAEYPRR